jgi:predicted Zn-dependent protease
LPIVTLALLVLVFADRVADLRKARSEPERRASQGATDPRSAGADVKVGSEDVAADRGVGQFAAAVGERGLRTATREQLTREASGTYLDSLVVTTDSVVRRWPDRWGVPLRIYLVEGGTPDYTPRLAEFAREAFDRWEQTGVGIRFEMVSDSAGADVVVRWIDRFDFDRAGQTDLTWDQLGRVRHATISLALRTQNGTPLPDAALFAVAVHEAGHAIGLPHSADTSDVMFPATRTGTLTERDRRTIKVLYRLPPGPVGEFAAR